MSMYSHNDAVSIGRNEMVSTYRKLKPLILRSTVRKPDCERLVSDMNLWTAYNGYSWLELATYQKSEDAEMRLRLVRTSHLKMDDGAALDDNIQESLRTYDMALMEFEGLNLSDLWFANALDVLHQRSDRALQHVGLHRRRQRLRRKNAFKLKRRVLTDYMMLGRDLIVGDTETVSDDVCPICQMNFDPDNNVIPLRLKCHPTHTICDDCYVTWAGTSNEVGCPHCRARMFTDDDLRMLIWGLGPTVKTYDPRAWETFQRANHDLDRYNLPEDDMKEFPFIALLLTKAWHYLVEGALLEPADSTPYHLQPVRFPETTFITSIIRDVFDEFDEHTRTEPHKYALQAIMRRLNAEFLNGQHNMATNFDLHHRVTVNYPVRPRGLASRYRLNILPVHNYQNRYDPSQPLIYHPKVIATTKLTMADDFRMVSFEGDAPSIDARAFHAKHQKIHPLLEFDGDQSLGPTRLMKDMAAWTAYNGTSVLDICTHHKYHGKSGKELVVWVHIRRSSELKLERGFTLMRSATYDLPLVEFEAIKTDALWHENALDVIYRRSDRAYFHVLLQAKSQNLTMSRTQWKTPSRELDALGKFPPVNDTSDLEDCAVCFQPLDGGQPVAQLPCHLTHALCRDCLRDWVKSIGLENVGCPFDRNPLYTAAEADFIRWGTRGRGYYPTEASNQDYTPFESFVRSLGDVDARDDDDGQDFLTVKPVVLMEFWDNLVAGMLRETNASTFLHLQPARYPGFRQVREYVKEAFEACADQFRPTDFIYEKVMDHVFSTLKQEHQKSTHFQTWTSAEQKCSLENDQCAHWAQHLRPGLLAFVRRMVQRTLMMAKIRDCNGTAGCAMSQFHYHGEKIYYNSAAQALEDELVRVLNEFGLM
ncbi:hypothetical protein LTR17_004208 [Elasticomyces elasticus]|nr:hypothetical protein LTR17_004208 [Elasticomyces elasticus]